MFAILVAVPAQAQQWWEAETDHFVIKSRDSEANTRAFAEELERYDGALRTLQNMAAGDKATPANKVTIFRFGDQDDIAHMAGAPGSGIAGFYISRAGASVAYVPARESRSGASIVRRDERTQLDGMSVLKHEYAHHFMMQNFPSAYPRWYAEGYAETVATIRFLEDGTFHVGDPPQYRAAQVMRLPAFRLEEMLDANHELTGMDALQHYGTGWLLSHYLNFDPEGRTKLAEFLSALAGGEDSLTAARRILGDLGALERKLSAYRRGNFPGYDVKPANYTPPRVTMRPLPADEVAFIEYKMELSRGVDRDDAAKIRNALRERVARQPDSVEGQLLLAEASYDSEDYAGAEQAAAKVVELDPNSVRGWLYRGMALTQQAKADPAQAGTLARQAREYLERAISLDQTDPRPLIAYYETYRETGTEAPEGALIALETAYEYAGSDAAYRLLLTRQLIAEERWDDARAVVQPATFQGHSTGEADADEGDPTPGRLMKAIADRDRAGAIAMIDDFLEPDEDEDEG